MPIKYGVTQGSALGPILFLLYVNDLNSLFNKTITIHFADETHLSYASKKLSPIESVMNYKLKKSSRISFLVFSRKKLVHKTSSN